MSSTPPSPTSSPPPQGSSPGPPGASQMPGDQNGRQGVASTGPGLTSSASLYLYTFLACRKATLILLLLVSATIIARSYVIRRRHREMIAEAIANGTFVPPATRVRVGRKPKMYQVALVRELEEEVVPAPIAEKGGGRPSLIEEKRRATAWDGLVVEWNRMMPVSCRLLRPPRPRPDTPVSTSPSPTPERPSRSWRLPWPGRGRRQFPSPPSPPSPPPASPRPSNPQSPPPSDPRPSSTTMRVLSLDLTEKTARTPTPSSASSSTEERVRVAVLISMPFALSMAAKKASEYGRSAPELPYMEFGVCEVPLEPSFDAPADSPIPPPPSNPPTGPNAVSSGAS
ncbi:hypothetical protein C8Q77DRAFT_1227555 [Trametes polyzona]|nr:hypothetical protein C8Q77DRAFT_1227555 [Trametes polyzona]